MSVLASWPASTTAALGLRPTIDAISMEEEWRRPLRAATARAAFASSLKTRKARVESQSLRGGG